MKNSLQSISTLNLVNEISLIKMQEAAGIIRICQILEELVDRKVNHDLLNSPICRWFREINSEMLHPEFVVAFCDRRQLIKAVCGMSLSEQQFWATGGALSLSELNESYEIETVTKPLSRFSVTNIKTVFNNGKIRSTQEQEKILREKVHNIAKTKVPKLARVRADTEKNCLLIGGKDIKIGELKEPLLALGFELTCIPLVSFTQKQI